MNPAAIFKLMSAKNKFGANHPKFMAFIKNIVTTCNEEGTVIEVTITRPGQAPVTGNMKVMESDLEVFESLKNMIKNKEMQD